MGPTNLSSLEKALGMFLFVSLPPVACKGQGLATQKGLRLRPPRNLGELSHASLQGHVWCQPGLFRHWYDDQTQVTNYEWKSNL